MCARVQRLLVSTTSLQTFLKPLTLGLIQQSRSCEPLFDSSLLRLLTSYCRTDTEYDRNLTTFSALALSIPNLGAKLHSYVHTPEKVHTITKSVSAYLLTQMGRDCAHSCCAVDQRTCRRPW
jgi:hypothetical protein